VEPTVPGLEVRNLVKRLGNHLAVDDLTFTVDDGEFFVLLGPSGCGKTTSLRIVCGLEQPDSGSVLIGDREVHNLPSRDRNLGMVFQEYGLYPSMDVFGNMAYGLQARGKVPRKEIESRVKAAAEKLDLTALLPSPITDLSGGEQQRVALGRAMVKDADAYLFDEPLSNLDPKLRHRLRRDIIAMHRDKGKPSVYVTHDQTEAFAMGDVVAVMAHGRAQQIGPPDELVSKPANVFVASFVGSPPMNLLPAELGAADGSYVARAHDATLTLPAEWSQVLARYGKDKVTLGIRPDAFVLRTDADLAPNGDGADGGTLSGEVTDVEPLIGETVVRMRTSEQTQLAAVFRAGEEGTLGPGDVVRVGVDAAGMRLFDAESAQALVP
jgi:multiple sugar transport system ATP-binding protein